MAKSLVTYKGKEFNTPVNKLLVRLNKHEEKTKSGIIIPSTVKKETDFSGVVVAISRGMEKDGSFVLGEKAIFLRHSGSTVETDDNENIYKVYKKTEIKWHGF